MNGREYLTMEAAQNRIQELEVQAEKNELESLLLAARCHIDGNTESKKFACGCLDKALMIVRGEVKGTAKK
jgi:hypothetical protein